MSCEDVTWTIPSFRNSRLGTDEDICVELTDDSGNGQQRSLE